ncbi:MAG: amidohydrolase [Proteobacteria bacterium]|nr:amidohydrolase [Pseudomonadota bacterium]
MARIRPEIPALQNWLVALRREIHRHPEPAYGETRTAGLVERTLRGMGLPPRTGIGRTGVVGLWRADRPGPCLGLRADMDALPVQEALDHDWRSTVPGMMHACGHDLHTAMLLGAARVLADDSRYSQRLAGAVKFIFQPAEEEGAGALAMIADGVLDDPPLDAIFSAHVNPTLETGQVGYTPGPAHAAVDNFHITVTGRGGHAAHPELADDPLAPAAELVGRIRSRSAGLDRALVAVCFFQAGTTTNVIPDRALISGTVRSLDRSARERALDAIRAAAAEAGAGSPCDIQVRLVPGYPILRNDESMTQELVRLAGAVVGAPNLVFQAPSYGAEDMAYFLDKVPGSVFGLGCRRPGDHRPAMLHSPRFDPDESVLALGVELFVTLAESFLSPSG